MISLLVSANYYAHVVVIDGKWRVLTGPYLSLEAHEIRTHIMGRTCTAMSVLALADAIKCWLQARYDAGDRTHAGLSAFVETARVEYLQPMEAA
jgi:hypothetical protein